MNVHHEGKGETNQNTTGTQDEMKQPEAGTRAQDGTKQPGTGTKILPPLGLSQPPRAQSTSGMSGGYYTDHYFKKQDNRTPIPKRKSDGPFNAPKKPRKLNLDTNGSTDDEGTEGTTKVSPLEKKVEELESRIKRKDLEINKLRKKAELKDKTIQKTQDLETRNKKILKENSALKRKITELNNELDDSRSSRSETNKKMALDLDRVRRERDDSKREYATAADLLKKAKKDRDGAKEALKKNEESLKRIRTEREQMKKNKNSVEDLENELENMKIQNAAAQSELKARAKEWYKKEKDLEMKFAKLKFGDATFSGEETENEVNELKSSDDEDSTVEDKNVQNLGDQTFNIEPTKDVEVTEVEDSSKNLPSIQEGSMDMFESQDYILPSDEEFPDAAEQVKNYDVKNYKNPKSSAVIGMKPPSKYQTGKFKPTVCSLNNRIIFVSTGALKYPHNPEKFSNNCGLSPTCNIKWNEDTIISRVFIFGSVNHPKNESEVWCCSHHNQASLEGYKLQTQAITRKHFAGYRNKEQQAEDREVGDETNPDVGVDGIKQMDDDKNKKVPSKLSLKSRKTRSSLKAGSSGTSKASTEKK